MNCLWRPCLLMNRDVMSANIYRGPFIDASYQVSVHLAQWFQRRRLKKNRPIRNKNCMWRPCLLMDRDEMSNHYRGPSIDASYQVAVHLDEGFQRRRLKCEKLTDDGREVMAKAHLTFGKVISKWEVVKDLNLIRLYDNPASLKKGKCSYSKYKYTNMSQTK